jgi:hypothetical protein
MKQRLLITLLLYMQLTTSAHEIELEDSINVDTGIIYYADSIHVNDTISTDTIDCANPPIPQIPLEECDQSDGSCRY